MYNKKERFRIMHGIDQLNISSYFHIMFIHISYAHYSLQIERATTKKLSNQHMLIKLGISTEGFHSFSFNCNYLHS